MTIVWTSGWYPHAGAPRDGNFVRRHARAAATVDDVFAVHAVLDPSMDRSAPERIDVATEGRFREVVVTAPAPRWPWQRIQRKWAAYRTALDRLDLRAGEVDLVHGAIVRRGGFWAQRMAHHLGTPYVLSEHWTGYHDPALLGTNALERAVMRRAVRDAAMVLPVSHDLAGAMRDRGFGARSEIVGNVVDTAVFHAKDAPVTAPRLLHVSHLDDDHKNVSGLLRAVSTACSQRPDLRLDVIGDGDWTPHAATVSRLGLEDSVRFLGERDAPAIADAMRASAAVVLFSRRENQPCVLLEALATGTPVVSSDVGGIDAFVDETNGRLVPSEDEHALTDALVRIIEQAGSYDPSILHRRIDETFSVEAIAHRLHELHTAACA